MCQFPMVDSFFGLRIALRELEISERSSVLSLMAQISRGNVINGCHTMEVRGDSNVVV